MRLLKFSIVFAMNVKHFPDEVPTTLLSCAAGSYCWLLAAGCYWAVSMLLPLGCFAMLLGCWATRLLGSCAAGLLSC